MNTRKHVPSSTHIMIKGFLWSEHRCAETQCNRCDPAVKNTFSLKDSLFFGNEFFLYLLIVFNLLEFKKISVILIRHCGHPFMYIIKIWTLEKCSITSYTLKGVSPPPLWLPRCDKSRTSATSSSLGAGAVWEDRHYPLLHRTCIVNFISREKEFPRAKI